MKLLLYDEDTLKLLRHLRSAAPKRIFADICYQVAFDYGGSYITGTPEVLDVASQNESDEAITVKFESFNSVYVPGHLDKLVSEGEPVTHLWVLRTFLHFTDHVVYESKEQSLAGWPEPKTDFEKTFQDCISATIGGHAEVVCHPQSLEAAEANQDYANLVDVGILAVVGGNMLGCFSLHNSFILLERFPSPQIIREEIVPHYQFIEIEPYSGWTT